MISFHDPGFLVLLVLPLIRLLWSRAARSRDTVEFPAVDAVDEAGTTWRVKTLWVPGFLGAAGIALCILALARPALVRARVPVLSEGIDLVVVVDRSSSMGEAAASDGRSALEIVIGIARDFIAARRNDRVGLVAFARYPETICPLTLDRSALVERLGGIAAAERGGDEDGTALGAGLAEAAALLEKSRAESKVVLLFTDGRENRFVIEPLAAARLLEGIGARAHTVAIDFDDVRRSGEEKLDTSLHLRIAEITGGRSFGISSARDLGEAMSLLDEMEKTPVEGRSFPLYEDVFRCLLFPGALVLLAGFVLGGTVYRRLP